jgi:hypothetical protein
VLAEGIAEPFTGPPVLTVPGAEYSFSRFPSFNSTPFGVPPTVPIPLGIVFNAAGSSEKLTAPKVPATSFPQYDVSVPIGPIAAGPLLLQKDIEQLAADGYTFEGTALNIAMTTPLSFLKNANSGAKGLTVQVAVPQFGGGIENIQFLVGESPSVGGKTQLQENAETAVVYATFWIEKVTHKQHGNSFMQLQYAQMVVLNFPIFHLLQQMPPIYVNLGWPHITVATLRKSFG